MALFDRTYVRETILWMALMMLGFIATFWMIKHFEVGSPWRYVGLAPYVFTMAGMYWTELRQIRRMDELQRQIYLVGTLSGSIFFMTFCATAWVGEVMQLWPRVAPIWGMAAMGAGFGLGLGIARRYYGG